MKYNLNGHMYMKILNSYLIMSNDGFEKHMRASSVGCKVSQRNAAPVTFSPDDGNEKT